jgi:hypothetical protein
MHPPHLKHSKKSQTDRPGRADDDVDYDLMWDSSRRVRSRSFRGAFRSRSREERRRRRADP